MKAFHYMLDAIAATIDVNNHIKAISLLNKVDEVMKQQEQREFKDFIITDEERARVECLRGQVVFVIFLLSVNTIKMMANFIV